MGGEFVEVNRLPVSGGNRRRGSVLQASRKVSDFEVDEIDVLLERHLLHHPHRGNAPAAQPFGLRINVAPRRGIANPNRLKRHSFDLK